MLNNSGDSSISVTSGSVIGSPGSGGYVSCIKVNGKPILPPLMSESVRAEMRRYRELAIRVETTLSFNKRPRPPVIPSRISQVPMNTTVTLSPKDIPPPPEPEVGSTAFDMLYTDHFVIKKPQPGQIPAFPSSDEDESCSSDSFKSATDPSFASVTYIKLQESPHSPIVAPPPFFQDDPPLVVDSVPSSAVPIDDDYHSEAMSLISLDEQERLERKSLEDRNGNEDEELGEDEEEEDNSENIPASGRSSTETYTIDKHYVSSDSENNNETSASVSVNNHKYFCSPIQGGDTSDDTSIVFNSESAPNTVKSHRTGKYFDSPPQSPSERLTDISSTTSVASTASTVESNPYSFLSPKSDASSKSSVRKRFYFSSPEESPAKSDSSHQESLIKHLPPSRIPSPRKILQHTPTKVTPQPLTPTKVNLILSSSNSEKENQNKIAASPSKTAAQTSRVLRTPTKTKTQASKPKKEEAKAEKDKPKSKLETSPTPIVNTEEVTDAGVVGPKSPPISQSLTRVNLTTLQSTLQNMSPSFFKAPSDARSPLLKGVVFPDSLYRPKRELRIPPQASDPAMQPKFARVTALAKGFLVRRLLRTEKLQMIIQTIRDTVELVLKLYEEVPQLKIRGWKGVNTEDAELCRRLFQQLTGACSSFHDVFFKLTTPQRMAIIASDREKLKAKEMRNYLSHSRSARGPSTRSKGTNNNNNNNNVSRRKISTATAKCLERRMSALQS